MERIMSKFMEDKPVKLLGVNGDAKTVKGRKLKFLTGILYLFPHKAFGFNICPNAENAGCIEPCLNTAGRGKMHMVQEARLRKTWLFHYDRDWFMAQLFRDIEALERKAYREGMKPCVRLNGTSDLDWENIRHEGFSPMEKFPHVQFYDYCKMPKVPKNNNYHLTFSYSTAPDYEKSVKKAARLGMNFAVVSYDPAPETWRGRPVVIGDDNDLRFLDPPESVIWLKGKGRAIKSYSDLIVKVA